MMVTKKSASFNWKQKFMAIALMIVTVAFVFTGIYMVFDGPSYEDHCYDKRAIPIEINSLEECDTYGGSWVEGSYCDMYSECSEAYDTESSKFRFNVFLTSFLIGAAILLSAIFIPIPIISAGMMSSGIVILLISLLQYWEKLGEVYRFVILGLLLAALIWIAVKKLK